MAKESTLIKACELCSEFQRKESYIVSVCPWGVHVIGDVLIEEAEGRPGATIKVSACEEFVQLTMHLYGVEVYALFNPEDAVKILEDVPNNIEYSGGVLSIISGLRKILEGSKET